MVILNNEDLFEVKISSLLAGYDRDTLTNLYQPLIGFSAVALYFSFWSEGNNQKVLSYSTHDQFLARMQMPVGKFIDARKLLEGVGLIKTKLAKENGCSFYHYELKAPKTPKEFFNDTLLYGMLIQQIGEEDANRIKKVYELNEENESGEDISSTFNDVFHPDLNNASFLKATNSNSKAIGRNRSKIATEFNYSKFFDSLAKNCNVLEKHLSKKEIKEINRLASLFDVNEEEMALIVSNSININNEKGERIDLKAVRDYLFNETTYTLIKKKNRIKNSKVDSDTLIAKKINLFESTSPKDILRLLQNGTKPATSDLYIIDTLSKDYRLSNGVINVIIDFVLTKNDNVFSRGYATKIAASFNRENITTTVDAMNYINRKAQSEPSKKCAEKEEKSLTKKDKSLEEDWNNLFSEEEGEQEDGKIESTLPF